MCTLTASRWPANAALYSGVLPYWPFTLGSAPNWTNNLSVKTTRSILHRQACKKQSSCGEALAHGVGGVDTLPQNFTLLETENCYNMGLKRWGGPASPTPTANDRMHISWHTHLMVSVSPPAHASERGVLSLGSVHSTNLYWYLDTTDCPASECSLATWNEKRRVMR